MRKNVWRSLLIISVIVLGCGTAIGLEKHSPSSEAMVDHQDPPTEQATVDTGKPGQGDASIAGTPAENDQTAQVTSGVENQPQPTTQPSITTSTSQEETQIAPASNDQPSDAAKEKAMPPTNPSPAEKSPSDDHSTPTKEKESSTPASEHNDQKHVSSTSPSNGNAAPPTSPSYHNDDQDGSSTPDATPNDKSPKPDKEPK